MPKRRHSLMVAALLAAALPLAASHAADPRVQRGGYLAEIIGCGDCHTAGSFLGHPDLEHYLGGSNVGFAIPAITTGVRPDGRVLAPIMPWRDFSHLTADDAQAIAMFLKSLKPVSNAVPGPFGPNDTPSVLVMTIVPGDVYARLPKGP